MTETDNMLAGINFDFSESDKEDFIIFSNYTESPNSTETERESEMNYYEHQNKEDISDGYSKNAIEDVSSPVNFLFNRDLSHSKNDISYTFIPSSPDITETRLVSDSSKMSSLITTRNRILVHQRSRGFANNRERKRQETVNGAFSELGKLLPRHPVNKKLSKSDILRKAIKYINLLNRVISFQKSGDGEQYNVLSPPMNTSFSSNDSYDSSMDDSSE